VPSQKLAADAQASLRSGKIVQSTAEQTTRTLADGLRTQSVGAINFEHIRRYVDDIVTVTEGRNPKSYASSWLAIPRLWRSRAGRWQRLHSSSIEISYPKPG